MADFLNKSFFFFKLKSKTAIFAPFGSKMKKTRMNSERKLKSLSYESAFIFTEKCIGTIFFFMRQPNLAKHVGEVS